MLKTRFKSNIDSDALKTVMRAVADWQLKTPLTHRKTDWTNGALYTGMVEWAKVADDSKYFDWLREIGVKNSWNYFKHDNPLKIPC
ncbi:MAG: glycoside hydrolase family 88 protein [Bacteroidales bacterium]